MSNQQQQQPSIEEVIQNIRDNILRTQSTASTASINGFDQLVQQLQVFAQQINNKNVEIARLQELCKKNSIDYAIPPLAEVKAPKMVTPPKPTKTKS